jgi:hypothetical protein
MGAELRRKREGLPTKTNMSEEQLRDFAATPRKKLPQRAPKRNKAFYGE